MAQQYIICIIQLYQTAEVLRTSFLVYAIGVALRFPSFQKFVLSNCQSQRRQISWWWFSHQVANFHPRKKRNKPRDFLFDYRAIPHFNLLTAKNFHQENSLSLSLSLPVYLSRNEATPEDCSLTSVQSCSFFTHEPSKQTFPCFLTFPTNNWFWPT